jgi:hypothetical protein
LFANLEPDARAAALGAGDELAARRCDRASQPAEPVRYGRQPE